MSALIQNVAALGLGAASSLSLFLMYRFANATAFFIVLCLWLALVIAVSILLRNISPEWFTHLPLGLATLLACVGLFTLVEWAWWRVFLVFLVGVLLTLLFGSAAYEDVPLGTVQKPWRRMKMMLWVFDAYALITTMFAFIIFFPPIPLWLLALVGAITLSGISFMIWRMYFALGMRHFVVWMAVVFIMIIELIWAFALLPFGYLVSGLLLTWIWYMLQLLIRFHLSPQGIVWRKQAGFLTVNAVLFILVMYVARWV